MDFDAIKKAAQKYGPDMTKFLRDMIAIPSESCEEKGVVHRIKEEMEKLGYDKVEIDGLGNVIGWMGKGDKIIAIDSHIDTVGIGNIKNWTDDPYKGYETDKIIYGRGGSDQEGGMASATYGARIMKDLGLIPEGYRIMVVGSVHHDHLVAAHAGGVHQNVDAPVGGHDLLDGLGDAVVIAHVAGGIHRFGAEFLLECGHVILESVFTPCEQGYLCSLASVCAGNLQAKTRRGARNDGDLVLDVEIVLHFNLLRD